LAERRRGALPLQDFEQVPVVRLRAVGVALFKRSSNVFAHGTAPGTVGILPRQAILLARRADDALGVLAHVVQSALASGIFLLRFHVTVADFDGVQFICADTA